MLRDLRYGLLILIKNKGFTLVAALTVAFGVGVNVARFSLLNKTLFDDLPFPEPDRLVGITACRHIRKAGCTPRATIMTSATETMYSNRWRRFEIRA